MPNRCTKATVLHHQSVSGSEALPRIQWNGIVGCDKMVLGKGVFCACYAAEVGCQKVCLKKFYSGSKYISLFCAEVKMLSLLCHYNLPWLHAICSDLNRCSILMSLHLYSVCDGKSLTVYNALTSTHEITPCNWKRALLAALVYLRSKNILHNDIKSDNILIEMLPSDARSVLIDFNKARFSEDGVSYKLSNEDKKKYASPSCTRNTQWDWKADICK